MNFRTWSPFQSDMIRQICEHMKPQEREDTASRGAMYGMWVALTFAIPLSFGLAHGLYAIAIPLIIVHIVCIPFWLKSQKQFLCQTEWAREQKVAPETLCIFSLRPRWTTEYLASVALIVLLTCAAFWLIGRHN